METSNPYQGYHYQVLIDGKEVAGFSEVTSSNDPFDVVEYRGADGTGVTPGANPGILRYSVTTLRRGISTSRDFMDWIKTVQDREITRRTVTILMMDAETQVAAWQLEKAWPTRYSAAETDKTGNELVIESLELACEGMTRIQ